MQFLKITPRLFMRHLNCPCHLLRSTKINVLPNTLKLIRMITTSHTNHKKIYQRTYFSDSDDELDTNYQEKPIPVKTLLYPNTDDALIEHLNDVASIQQVFDFIKNFKSIIMYKHLAQTVLVLWDLQKMYHHINVISNVPKLDTLMKDYVNQLVGREEFSDLLKEIEERVKDFDAEALSCTLMYLNKIGVPLQHPTLQIMVEHMTGMLHDASLMAISRFISTIFRQNKISSYFIVQDVIPRIYNDIEHCETSNDFKFLTISLNRLNKIVPLDILEKYKIKAKELIAKGVIGIEDPSCLLEIILFLNYPAWRDRNTTLMSHCMKLFKGNMNLLNAQDIIILFNIFYRIQEPAEILNELQRYARKFLQELEEEMCPMLDIRLKLLTCATCFASTTKRKQFENIIREYMAYDLKGVDLMELNKAMLHVKISDPNLWKKFWEKVLFEMEHDDIFKESHFLKICYCYMNFSQAVHLRNFKLEKRINQWLEGQIEQSIGNLIPSYYSGMATFIFAYGMDVSIINYMVNKLSDNWEQLSAIDCQNIAKSLSIGLEVTGNANLKPRYVDSLNKTLDKCIVRLMNTDLNVNIVSSLMKNYIHRNKLDGACLPDLLLKCEEMDYLSSKIIKNIVYCLHSTSALVPKVLDKMVDYIIESKESVMAFNAEKVAHLCYYLGYTPKKYIAFSNALVDMIIRDQEKLTGLCQIHSCLALCYFNTLPSSLISQIFNTNFLEKLDLELLNCYSKELYPTRVRDRLMELNRAVCLDYPESKVPWFHEKHVEDTKKKKNLGTEPEFTYKVREYLVKIFQKPERILKHVVTPYGYHIDYVVHLSDNNNANAGYKKFAILLTPERAFTTFNIQLKGYYQVKTRHLEMFGYRVTYLNFNDWRHLIYGMDKVNYIKNLFMPRVLNVIEVNR